MVLGDEYEYDIVQYMVCEVRHKVRVEVVVVGVLGEDRRGYSDISPLAATKTNAKYYYIGI